MPMQTVIINKRHELPRSKRIIWDVATVVLWLGFLYLWKPVIVIFYRIVTLDVPSDEIADWIYENIYSVTVEHAFILLVVTPIVLFVLSRLHRHQLPTEHLLFSREDYCKHFGIEEQQMKQCDGKQVVTVHHDEHGKIVKLDSQNFALTPA